MNVLDVDSFEDVEEYVNLGITNLIDENLEKEISLTMITRRFRSTG
jgi:hypothetical protein